MSITTLRNSRGFSLIELLVATTTMVVVLGAAVALTSQVQNGYRRQLEDSAAEQEGRYAIDWITRHLRGAGNDPHGKAAIAPGTTDCPAANTPIAAIQFDPDADGADDDVRLMTDANPADGLFGGEPVNGCIQANEDITISHDDVNNSITFLDNNTGGALTTRTDTVIENLNFVFRDSAYAVLDSAVANPANVVWVETQMRIRTRTIDATSGQPLTRLLTSEVRVRSR